MTTSISEISTDMKMNSKGKTARFYKSRLTAAAIIAAAACFLRFAARNRQDFSDAWLLYVNPIWVNTLGRIAGLFPFSLVEFLIYAIIVGILFFIGRTICLAAWGKRRQSRTDPFSASTAAAGVPDSAAATGGHPLWTGFFKRGVTRILLLAAIIFFLYEGGEDVYFFCTPFSTTYGYGNGSYSSEQLTEVCRFLVDMCNTYTDKVDRDEDNRMSLFPYAKWRARQAMENLGDEYPILDGWYPKAKGVCISRLMSKTNMAGIYSAYTSEANYNTEMPAYNKPFTMCHELSHLKGVLPENEANFAAYLACVRSDQPDLIYSGCLTGWVYCGNELYKRDREAWREIAVTLSAGANADLEYNTAFWKQFRGKAADAAEKFNDSYLKQAGQSAGTESYNQVVDLIVSYETGKSGH